VGAARGELIVQCDADDLAEPDRLEWTVRAWKLAGNRPCLLFGDFSEIDEQDAVLADAKLGEYSALQALRTQALGADVALIEPRDAFGALLVGNFIRPCVAALPRSLFDRIGGFDETLGNGQDYDLYLRIAWNYPAVWIRRVVGLYRRAPGNISSLSAIRLAPARIAVLRRILGLPLFPQEVRAARRWIATHYEDLGYDHGCAGHALESLRSYWGAFSTYPRLGQVRGALAGLVKSGLLTLLAGAYQDADG
jgi:hypothetical protein